jgi:hypothetical protein
MMLVRTGLKFEEAITGWMELFCVYTQIVLVSLLLPYVTLYVTKRHNLLGLAIHIFHPSIHPSIDSIIYNNNKQR